MLLPFFEPGLPRLLSGSRLAIAAWTKKTLLFLFPPWLSEGNVEGSSPASPLRYFEIPAQTFTNLSSTLFCVLLGYDAAPTNTNFLVTVKRGTKILWSSRVFNSTVNLTIVKGATVTYADSVDLSGTPDSGTVGLQNNTATYAGTDTINAFPTNFMCLPAKILVPPGCTVTIINNSGGAANTLLAFAEGSFQDIVKLL